MGAFIVNFHVLDSSVEAVSESLLQIPVDSAWVAPAGEHWMSFWEELASNQDESRITELSRHVSGVLHTTVLAFLVHDSDVLC